VDLVYLPRRRKQDFRDRKSFRTFFVSIATSGHLAHSKNTDSSSCRCLRECSIRLNASFDTLDQSKKECQEQYHDSNPKCIPLHTIPSVRPPLRQALWLRLVEHFLQNNKSITPEVKAINMPIDHSQRVALNSVSIQVQGHRELAKPFSSLRI
jgi:hypothetical protein